MAHPPPPPGPPPGIDPIGEREESFRLAVSHVKRIRVRNGDGGRDTVRQYIYKSAWYRTEHEVRWLQAEIKCFLYRVGMLGLFESFTHWRIQKMSDVEQAIWRAQATTRAIQRGYQGAESFQPEPRGATDETGVSMSSWSSDSRSSDSR